MPIKFINVSKSFGRKTILEDVSFEIPNGNIVFILGKSGTGKSVTLKTIVGLLPIDSGEIFVGEYSIYGLNEDELGNVRKSCGMVFQHPALLDSLTVFENISFAIQDRSEIDKRKRVLECLNLVHLDQSILGKLPSEISYGMQKRVSLARTLAPQPQYLLFDEPTTGLDPITTTVINELILELSQKLNVTSIVVSHDMQSALKFADHIVVLDHGHILAYETPEQIKLSKAPLIQAFLHEATL